MRVELSIVVPTRDRPLELEQMLAAVAAGTLPPDRFEVIVADNGVGARTAEVVAEWAGRFHRLVRVPVPAPGLHAGRHAGLAVARADLLVFADDDIIANPRWLEAIIAAFGDAKVGLVGGNNLPRFAAPPPAWLARLWKLRRTHGRWIEALSVLDFGGTARDIPPQFVFGCNFAVRRRVLLEAGGFHPDGFPEKQIRFRGDGETHVADFVARHGWRARLEPLAAVEHLVPVERMTPEYFERRYFAQGISDSYAAIRAGGLAARGRLPGLPAVGPRELVRLLVPPGLAPLRWRWWRAQRKGFRYHHDQVAADSALLDWVLQDTYF